MKVQSIWQTEESTTHDDPHEESGSSPNRENTNLKEQEFQRASSLSGESEGGHLGHLTKCFRPYKEAITEEKSRCKSIKYNHILYNSHDFSSKHGKMSHSWHGFGDLRPDLKRLIARSSSSYSGTCTNESNSKIQGSQFSKEFDSFAQSVRKKTTKQIYQFVSERSTRSFASCEPKQTAVHGQKCDVSTTSTTFRGSESINSSPNNNDKVRIKQRSLLSNISLSSHEFSDIATRRENWNGKKGYIKRSGCDKYMQKVVDSQENDEMFDMEQDFSYLFCRPENQTCHERFRRRKDWPEIEERSTSVQTTEINPLDILDENELFSFDFQVKHKKPNNLKAISFTGISARAIKKSFRHEN